MLPPADEIHPPIPCPSIKTDTVTGLPVKDFDVTCHPLCFKEQNSPPNRARSSESLNHKVRQRQ